MLWYLDYFQFIMFFFFLMIRRPPRSTLFSLHDALPILIQLLPCKDPPLQQPPPDWTRAHFFLCAVAPEAPPLQDRKSTRLNSSHANISYAVFCLKKKKKKSIYCIIIHNCHVSSLDRQIH